jgi:hypothetical protein
MKPGKKMEGLFMTIQIEQVDLINAEGKRGLLGGQRKRWKGATEAPWKRWFTLKSRTR